MRIFRRGAGRSGPENPGLESNSRIAKDGFTVSAFGYVLEKYLKENRNAQENRNGQENQNAWPKPSLPA
jgi:hypothetical protein